MKSFFWPLLAALASLVICLPDAQANDLQSGPMAGYTTMREAAIWVQTKKPATVQLAYWPKDNPSQRRLSDEAQTTAKDAFIAELIATNLTPGTTYEYEVYVDTLSQKYDYTTEFQTPPFYAERIPPPDFSVAIGGGHYVNDPPYDPPNRIPGGDYSIFLAILAKNPDLMIWLGNNVSLREPDWSSRSGTLARYTKNRSQAELQPLLASVNHVATISSSDFGPSGADRFYPSASHAEDGFELFWANQPLGQPEVEGVASVLKWSDAEFFLLDDRSNRDLNPEAPSKRSILGQEQLDWLVNSLKRSTATFKIVVMGSPMANPADNPANYRILDEERNQFMERIRNERIEGLFLVSGGKDYGELTKMVRANAPDLYEVTLGPMTGRAAGDTKELNYFRVPSTSIFQRHFAVMDFHGPETDRQLRLTTYDVNGSEIWSENFRAADMSY